MAHELLRLTQRLCNRPQLISPITLGSVIHYLEARNTGDREMRLTTNKVAPRRPILDKSSGVGLVAIEGALTNIAYTPECGEESCSYYSLTTDIQALVDEGITTLVLDIDSGGGEAYGCFEATNEVRQLANDNGIKIVAYVDGLAASAAYAWAAIADELVVNPMAKVGSIGVVVQLMNTIKAERQIGLERTFVHAGDSKIPFDAEGNFTESFIADLQADVDFFYQEFVEHVALHRGMSNQAVIDTQAKVFLPEQALQLGLADKIMTKQDFLDYVFSNSL